MISSTRKKVAYIVAFNVRNPRSMLYRKIETFEGLVKILKRLWNEDERFIVVSLRIYSLQGERTE